jgi:hypothetical protein
MALHHPQMLHATGAVRLSPLTTDTESSNFTDCAMFVIRWSVMGQIAELRKRRPYDAENVINVKRTSATNNKWSND